jgi:hypothetical protein
MEEAIKNLLGEPRPVSKIASWKERWEQLMKYEGIGPLRSAEEIDAEIRALRGDD